MEEYFVYFPFFKPQTGGKRSAIQPQTIYSEVPKLSSGRRRDFPRLLPAVFYIILYVLQQRFPRLPYSMKE